MAGTLFGLGLSQQFYGGQPAAGALLYVYNANGTTPQSTYAEFALSTLQTFPVVADGEGRLPQIWVADGSYRVRLTTSGGIQIFDEASVTAIGASSGGSSGGGSAAVDATTIFQTGDTIWVPYSGTRSGWVRGNGRTIGSGSSSASERANADTQDLYEWFWNNFADSLCAVATGRGGSATSDFNANKALAVLDMRGRSFFGLDDMGNSAGSIIVAGTPTVAGSGSGAETVTLTTSNLPNYNLDLTSVQVKWNQRTDVNGTGSNTAVTALSSSGTQSTTALAGTLASGGGGGATNKMPPYRLCTIYFKL